MYMLQKEKKAKEENEYYKNKQSAWQQFQQRTQKRRKLLVAEGVISDRMRLGNVLLTPSIQERKYFPHIGGSAEDIGSSSDRTNHDTCSKTCESVLYLF